MPVATEHLPSLDSAIHRMRSYFEGTYKREPSLTAVRGLISMHSVDGYSCVARPTIVDRDLCLLAANMMAIGSGSEVLVAGMDTLSKLIPKDIEDYIPGSFQKELDEKGDESGVHSSLCLVYMRRGGFRWQYICPYEVDSDTGEVTWGDSDQARLLLGSRVGDGLVGAFQRRPFPVDPQLRLSTLATMRQSIPVDVAFHHADPVEHRMLAQMASKMSLVSMNDFDDEEL